jgi:hypothetical protein
MITQINVMTGEITTRDMTPEEIAALPPPPTPAEILAAERAGMVASRRQIRLALGEDACDAMDAVADDPSYLWAMRDQIKSAHEWHRAAAEIDEFAWIMGMTPDQVDDLFRRAMAL